MKVISEVMMKRLLFLILSLPLFTNAAEADGRHFKTIEQTLAEGKRLADELWPKIQSEGSSVGDYFDKELAKIEEEAIKKRQGVTGKKAYKDESFPQSISAQCFPKDVDTSYRNNVLDFLREQTEIYRKKLGIVSPINVFVRTNPEMDCSQLRRPNHLIFISKSTLEEGPDHALGVLLHEISHLSGSPDYLEAVSNARITLRKFPSLREGRLKLFSDTTHEDEFRADKKAASLGKHEADAVLGSLIKRYYPSPEIKRKNSSHPSYRDRIRSLSAVAHLHTLEASATNTPKLPDSGIASPFSKS